MHSLLFATFLDSTQLDFLAHAWEYCNRHLYFGDDSMATTALHAQLVHGVSLAVRSLELLTTRLEQRAPSRQQQPQPQPQHEEVFYDDGIVRLDPLEVLPLELIANIISFLPAPSAVQCFLVNREWRRLASLDFLWQCMFERHFGHNLDVNWLSCPAASAAASDENTGASYQSYKVAYRALIDSNLADHAARVRALMDDYLRLSALLHGDLAAQAELVQEAAREQMRAISSLGLTSAVQLDQVIQSRERVRQLGCRAMDWNRRHFQSDVRELINIVSEGMPGLGWLVASQPLYVPIPSTLSLSMCR